MVFNEERQKHLNNDSQEPTTIEEDWINAECAEDIPNCDSIGTDSLTSKRGILPVQEAENEVTMGERLPPIDRDESTVMEDTYDQDTIVVRIPQPSENNKSPPAPEAGLNQPSTLRRSHRIHQPQEMFGLLAWPPYMAVVDEPLTLQEALEGENAVAWKRAWESELDSLRKNATWVIAKVPMEWNIVGCRWLFRRKEDERFKVRLVAKGYSQQPGIDFKETFAPVGKFTTLRVLLALVAENDWELHSMDVKTAFLNGELEEEIFMEYPEGVEEIPEPGYACRLIKAIYGLRQSPRAWYQKIHMFFINHEFYRSSQDYSLYINYDKRILVLVYVDDLVLAPAEKEDIGWIKNCLAKAFEMRDLGELTTFLGLEIKRDRKQRVLSISQHNYIDRILHRHGMQDARPVLTPLDHNTRLISTMSHNTSEDQEVNLELYQSAVGSLMYAMLGSRPDLAYSVGLVSQFNHCPKPEHWIAVKRIFRYLIATKSYALWYGLSNASGGYSDAEWESGEDRKSVGGSVCLLN